MPQRHLHTADAGEVSHSEWACIPVMFASTGMSTASRYSSCGGQARLDQKTGGHKVGANVEGRLLQEWLLQNFRIHKRGLRKRAASQKVKVVTDGLALLNL